VSLNAKERYFVDTVASDLTFLREEWDEDIDDDSLRRSSAVLRILLVDGAYGRAWRLVGLDKEPLLVAVDLDSVLASPPRADITYAQAGGARYGGMEISPILIGDGVLDDSDAQALDSYLSQDFTREFGISSYTESDAIFGLGRRVKRREVIQYVANRLGGAHLELEGGHTTPQAFDVLDELARMELAGKPAVYYELLATGQAVAASGGAGDFLAAVEAL